MSEVTKVLEQVAAELMSVVKSRPVIGTPVSDGTRVVVPLSEVTLCFGGAGAGGSSKGTEEKNTGRGEGGMTGGAVTVRPLCALVIEGENVRIEAVAR